MCIWIVLSYCHSNPGFVHISFYFIGFFFLSLFVQSCSYPELFGALWFSIWTISWIECLFIYLQYLIVYGMYFFSWQVLLKKFYTCLQKIQKLSRDGSLIDCELLEWIRMLNTVDQFVTWLVKKSSFFGEPSQLYTQHGTSLEMARHAHMNSYLKLIFSSQMLTCCHFQ